MQKSILSILVFFIALQVKSQTNYYVSVSGNDNANGLFTTPWKTIQNGINKANTNDTLNILSGTYNEMISVTKSNIYIRNYTGNTPILSGAGLTSQDAMLAIIDRSNITVDGLEIANNIKNDAQGILIDGNCQNITIKNCKIHDIHFSSNPSAVVNDTKNAQGIIVYGSNASTAISNLKIQNNTLYNCRLGYSEGIAVNGNVDGFEVTGNIVHDLTNIGIDAIGHEGTCSNAANDQARNGLIKNNIVYKCLSPYATSGGLYVDGGKNIIIENNTSYHNGYGIEIGCENVGKTTDNINVRNNIFYDNEICAVAMGGYAYPGGSGKVTNCSVRNNTCYKNDYSTAGTGELYLSYSENSVIENNIFYLSAQNILAYAELGQPSLNFNYNLFFSDNSPADFETDWNGNPDPYTSFAAFKTGTGTNANSTIGNPLFINAAIVTPDFHLGTTSAAKEKGNPAFVAAFTERDMDHELRISGIVDCGADESGSPVVYTFTGNGSWKVANNWMDNIIPPTTLTGNSMIIIDPASNGECVLSTEQHISNGAQLKVNTNKKFRITDGLTLQH